MRLSPPLSPPLGLALVFSFTATFAACDGNSYNAGPDSGGVVGSTDATPLSDADNTSLTDASMSYDDAGTTSGDGGSFLNDGGFAVDDGGSFVNDGGSFLDDGGFAVNDGGSFLDDGGSFVNDGGTTSIGEACQNACDLLEACFAEGDSSCVGECSDDLAANCSAAEIDKVNACADGSCSAFESCILDVACLGGA